jgi:hypothetical protein
MTDCNGSIDIATSNADINLTALDVGMLLNFHNIRPNELKINLSNGRVIVRTR